ncbi:DUF2478 domain-containing protein [Thalassovita aquimarina]|uniref:DUF2478 domain-containing protein n=1 Tax=Thalassovita aquimarina TaxID=2785917 RepID=UPI003568B660
MNIAYTIAAERGDTDLLLHGLATSLLENGYNPTGAVQINTDRADAGRCDMDVKVLPHGPVIRISQSLGAASRGCRLDPSALETAVGLVERRLAQGADCLIVNKFGKHEAEGRGFRAVIAEALSLGIPVLVGLNRLNADAFFAFTGGMATELPPRPHDIREWLRLAMTKEATAA